MPPAAFVAVVERDELNRVEPGSSLFWRLTYSEQASEHSLRKASMRCLRGVVDETVAVVGLAILTALIVLKEAGAEVPAVLVDEG